MQFTGKQLPRTILWAFNLSALAGRWNLHNQHRREGQSAPRASLPTWIPWRRTTCRSQNGPTWPTALSTSGTYSALKITRLKAHILSVNAINVLFKKILILSFISLAQLGQEPKCQRFLFCLTNVLQLKGDHQNAYKYPRSSCRIPLSQKRVKACICINSYTCFESY